MMGGVIIAQLIRAAVSDWHASGAMRLVLKGGPGGMTAAASGWIAVAAPILKLAVAMTTVIVIVIVTAITAVVVDVTEVVWFRPSTVNPAI
jgi:hypothetical protein